MVLQRPGPATFTVEIPTSQAYIIRVLATEPTSFSASIEIPPLPEEPEPAAEPFDVDDYIGIEYEGDPPGDLALQSGQCPADEEEV